MNQPIFQFLKLAVRRGTLRAPEAVVAVAVLVGTSALPTSGRKILIGPTGEIPTLEKPKLTTEQVIGAVDMEASQHHDLRTVSMQAATVWGLVRTVNYHLMLASSRSLVDGMNLATATPHLSRNNVVAPRTGMKMVAIGEELRTRRVLSGVRVTVIDLINNSEPSLRRTG